MEREAASRQRSAVLLCFESVRVLGARLRNTNVDRLKDSVRCSPEERFARFIRGALRFCRVARRQALALVLGRPNACRRFEAILVGTFVTAAVRVGARVVGVAATAE